MKAIFVSGTDTGVGKTFISCLLLKHFNNLGYKTFGIKWIASGCEYNQAHFLENEDALLLQERASLYKPYSIVNPISFKEPIAPHIAALKRGTTLSKNVVKTRLLSSIQTEADINIIEGAGGWCVPLNEHELISEVIVELKIPVILVVGLKLGCLNHAILTYEHIKKMPVPFIGWIGNALSKDMLCIQENIDTLKTWIKDPCLGMASFNAQTIRSLKIDEILRFLF